MNTQENKSQSRYFNPSVIFYLFVSALLLVIQYRFTSVVVAEFVSPEFVVIAGILAALLPDSLIVYTSAKAIGKGSTRSNYMRAFGGIVSGVYVLLTAFTLTNQTEYIIGAVIIQALLVWYQDDNAERALALLYGITSIDKNAELKQAFDDAVDVLKAFGKEPYFDAESSLKIMAQKLEFLQAEKVRNDEVDFKLDALRGAVSELAHSLQNVASNQAQLEAKFVALPSPKNDLDLGQLSEAVLAEILRLNKRGFKATEIAEQTGGVLSWQFVSSVIKKES